jgi:hypothetical protein
MNTPDAFAAVAASARCGTSKISGRVTGFPGAETLRMMKLRVYGQSGPGNSIVIREVPVQENGFFEIAGVAFGEYSLSLGDPFHSPSRNFTFRDGNVTDLEMKVPVEVAGRLVTADGQPVPGEASIRNTSPAAVTVNSRAPREIVTQAFSDAAGRFSLGLFPGENRISLNHTSGANQLPPGYSIKSITYGGQDVTNTPLTLNAPPKSTLVIVLERP